MLFCRNERLDFSLDDYLRPAPCDPAASAAVRVDAEKDVVVRSTDGHEYGFLKATLDAASPKLADKVTGVAPPKKKGERITIKLKAPGAVVERFLVFLHPTVADPKLTTDEQLAPLVRVAEGGFPVCGDLPLFSQS